MLRGALPLEGIYVKSSGDQSTPPDKNTEEVGQYSICMFHAIWKYLCAISRLHYVITQFRVVKVHVNLEVV